jgi:hypothetical protein
MTYGLEVYNSSGNTVLSYTSRVPRFVQSGTFVANATSNTDVTVTNMANNDSWDVFLAANSASIDIRYTLNTGFFRATNGSVFAVTVQYWVVRS